MNLTPAVWLSLPSRLSIAREREGIKDGSGPKERRTSITLEEPQPRFYPFLSTSI